MKSTLKLLKAVSFDVLKLYKNFVHWNISKIVISVVTIILWFVMALPFIFVLVVLYFSFNLSVYLDSIQVNMISLYTFLWQRPVLFFVFMLFVLLAWLTMLFWYSYKKVLLTKLNLAYINWEKLSYKNKSYFDFKLIWKYIWVISWVSLFVAIPILVFLVIFFVLFFSFWWSEWVQSMIASSRFNPFTVLSFLLFVVCLIAFVYISYRLFFAVVFLSDEKMYNESKKAFDYLKESSHYTKSFNTFSRFILTLLLVFIIIFPLWTLSDYFSKSLNDVRIYKDYLSLTEEQKKVVDENTSSSYYINKLKLDYGNFSESGLNSAENTYFYLTYIFIVINFLLVFWLLEMAVVSFYKNEILNKRTV